MKTLNLVLTGYWYDETEAGRKPIEYRAMTPHWRKRIWDRRGDFLRVRFYRGYTKRNLERDVVKIDIGPCPIQGWDGEYYRIHSIDPNA